MFNFDEAAAVEAMEDAYWSVAYMSDDGVEESAAGMKAALAALKPLGGIPEGWALVPIKPTEEMVWVGRESIDTCTKEDPCGKAAEHCWADMLAASPDKGGE